MRSINEIRAVLKVLEDCRKNFNNLVNELEGVEKIEELNTYLEEVETGQYYSPEALNDPAHSSRVYEKYLEAKAELKRITDTFEKFEDGSTLKVDLGGSSRFTFLGMTYTPATLSAILGDKKKAKEFSEVIGTKAANILQDGVENLSYTLEEFLGEYDKAYEYYVKNIKKVGATNEEVEEEEDDDEESVPYLSEVMDFLDYLGIPREKVKKVYLVTTEREEEEPCLSA